MVRPKPGRRSRLAGRMRRRALTRGSQSQTSSGSHGVLISIDGVAGGALAAAAEGLRTNGYRGAGISEWDASGIFGELISAEQDAGAPSPRVLLLLYAA